MMPVTQTITTAGAQTPISLDYMPVADITVVIAPVGAGTLTGALLQVTLDDVFDPASGITPATATWVAPPATYTPPTAAPGSSLNFAAPWRAVRLNTTGGITGTTIFQVAQAVTSRS